jgi:hypothetical protein
MVGSGPFDPGWVARWRRSWRRLFGLLVVSALLTVFSLHRQHHPARPRMAQEGPQGCPTRVYGRRCQHRPCRRRHREAHHETGQRRRNDRHRRRPAARPHLAPQRVRARSRWGIGERLTTGVATNEFTAMEDRDPWAGTPWHKTTPARLEPAWHSSKPQSNDGVRCREAFDCVGGMRFRGCWSWSRCSSLVV